MQKKPSWKTNYIVSAFFILLLLTVVWYQYSFQPKHSKLEELAEKGVTPLPSIDSQISAIRIKNSKGLFEFKCESLAEKECSASMKSMGKWTLIHSPESGTEPLPLFSNDMHRLLVNIAYLKATKMIDLSKETADKISQLLTEYGLNESQRSKPEAQFYEIVLPNEPGKPDQIITGWIGQTNAIGDQIFVTSAHDGKLNTNTIFMIDRRAEQFIFEQSVSDLLPKKQ